VDDKEIGMNMHVNVNVNRRICTMHRNLLIRFFWWITNLQFCVLWME